MWNCVCDCGNKATIRSSDLTGGHTKSCGCLVTETAFKHGATLCKNRNKLYRVWISMRSRCINKKLKVYKYYGGRGIKVCEEWNNFQVFESWAKNNGYKIGLQIDRINNNGNYNPLNCRFITALVNSINRRTTKFITHLGKTLTLSDWSRMLSGNRNYLSQMEYKTGKSYKDIIDKKISLNQKFKIRERVHPRRTNPIHK